MTQTNPPSDLSAILVLEDDAIMRELLSDLLSEEGYLVRVATRGEEAIQSLADSRIDMIIFDIRMEGIDGLEAFARMRQGGLDVPSLAISGFADDDAPLRALRLGVGDYLRKPFRPEQLLESVARLLDEHRQRERLQASLDNLRELTRWAALILPGKPQPAQHVYQFARLAGELGEAAGLLPVAAGSLELSTLVMSVDPSSRQREDCPASIRAWASSLEERYDGSGPKGLCANDIPLEVRIVVLAHAASTTTEPDQARALIHKFPGRFDPFLLEALARLSEGAQPGSGGRRLNLARALLAGADRDEARRSLQRFVLDAQPSQAVQAYLGLAQLAHSPEAALDALEKALTSAGQVGPASLARTLYQAGLTLTRLSHQRGPEMLRASLPRLAALGMDAEATLGALLTGQVDEEKLEFILRPEHEPELAATVDLLLPSLQNSGPGLEKSLRRLSLRYPGSGEAASGTPALRICSFGGLRIYWAGKPFEESSWRGPLAMNLFAFIASHDRPVLEDDILEHFWPEGHETSKRRLSTTLSTIRRTFAKATGIDSDPFVRTRGRFQVNGRLQAWNDVSEFEKASRAASEARRKGHIEEAVPHWKRMASVHTAPYLEGCYMDWALRLREKFEAELVEALMQLAEYSQNTDAEQALEWAQRVVQMDPLQQRAYAQSMQAFLKLGQPENAVRCFRRCEELLGRELKVEPSIELLTLFHRAKLALP